MARKLLSFSLRCHCVTVQRGLSLELSYHLHGCTKAWDWRMAYCLLVMASCRSEQSSCGARLSPIPRSTGQSSRDGGWHGDPCLRLWELVRQDFFFSPSGDDLENPHLTCILTPPDGLPRLSGGMSQDRLSLSATSVHGEG